MYEKILALLVIVGVIGFSVALTLTPVTETASVTEGTWIHGIMSVYHNGELVYRGHNTLTNLGKNGIRDLLAQNKGTNITYLAVGNGSDITAGDTALDGEISDCGFSRVEVAGNNYTETATGNWSFEYQFTSQCDNLVTNTSGMFNQSSGAVMFWGDNFADTTLQSSDTLKITWNISVTGA